MSDNTKIEWADATANYVNGCSVVSPGCTNCFAMRLAGTRMKHHPTRAGLTIDTKAGPVWNGTIRTNDKVLAEVLGWAKPRRIFWNSGGDLFHEAVRDEVIDRQFAVMALTPQHIHMVLTKRPERMRDYMTDLHRWHRNIGGAAFEVMLAATAKISGAVTETYPAKCAESRQHALDQLERGLPNVWLGTSVEDQTRADERIPHLLATPAALRFISAEPLLGPVDLTKIESTDVHDPFDPFDAIGRGWHDTAPKIDWVIVGGESGPNARPMHPDWARNLRDQCAAADVPFHFKQWGEWAPVLGAVDSWDLNDDPEQSRFDHRDWEDGAWGQPYRPAWCDETDDDTVLRVGKKRAGRLLDGVQHDGFPS